LRAEFVSLVESSTEIIDILDVACDGYHRIRRLSGTEAFIKEYYKMATSDLDRHLKAGWQTIAVLAGGAAILTAGHDAKIGLPIAVAIALISAFWGVLTVIDANYWSLRAIAFLANVEAVYFSAEDRRYFNPYIGYHPSLKLLNSLRYMFWLCVLFGTMAALSMLWEISRTYPTAALIWAAATMGTLNFRDLPPPTDPLAERTTCIGVSSFFFARSSKRRETRE
jgi:hypothetical protein